MDLMLYVYGNGDFIYNILTSVNFFMQNAMSFFKLAAVLSLLFFAVEATGILPTRGYDWTKFIKVYFLISVFVLTPYPGKVTVNDVLTNQNYVFNFSKQKLPIGLIFPIAVTSDVMHRVIALYQQNFEIDENLNYTKSGMAFGANFIQSLDNASSYDDKFSYNLDHYMQNCGFPLLNKSGALSELRTSKDIFATLALPQYTSAARFVQQVDFTTGGAIVKPCNQAITNINSYFDANKDKIMLKNAQMQGVDTAMGFTQYMNSANAATSELLGISQGAATALKQAIAMNMIMTSIKNGAQSVGNGSLALAAYDAEQFQGYKKTGELSGAATARTIPILVGMLFALLFFLYPVMIFLAIAAGSYKAIGVFLQIIVAINLIPLIYEILNFFTTFYLEKKLGTVITGQGFSYDVSTSIYSFTDNMIIAGNYLATSAPLISYALVTGSAVALTSVFSHINDPAKSQSMESGREFNKGNLNLGNTSIDNTSTDNVQSNKLDTQLSMNTGVASFKDTTSGGMHTNVGGKEYDQNFKSDLLANVNFGQMASSSLQNSLSHNQQEMGQLSKQWGQQQQRLHELGNTLQSHQGSSISGGSEEAKTLQHAQVLASTISGTVGASVGGNGASAGISSAANDELQHNLNEYQRAANELSHSSDKSIRDAFSNSSSLTSNSSKIISETLSTSQALNDVNSNQSSINANFSNDFDSDLRSRGMEPNQMSASEQTTAAQQFVAQKLNNMYGIKTNLQGVSTNNSDIDTLSNSAASNNVNSNRIDRPDDDKQLVDQGNALSKNVHNATTNFSENQGNVIGQQIAEQNKTLLHTGKNIVELGGEFLQSLENEPEEK